MPATAINDPDARDSVSSAASPSADSRQASGGSPRSVHASGSVICPLTPPEQTNTVPPPAPGVQDLQPLPLQRVERMSDNNRSQGSLDGAALCRLRRDARRRFCRPPWESSAPAPAAGGNCGPSAQTADRFQEPLDAP